MDNFTEGLAAIYSRMAEALKPGAPLAFTYHHNKIEAYYAVGVAILDAGLTCSASLPCRRKWPVPSIFTAQPHLLLIPCSYAALSV